MLPVRPVVVPSDLFLYDDRLPANVSVGEVGDRLSQYFARLTVSARDEFILHHTASHTPERKEQVMGNLAENLAAIRVRDPEREASFSEPPYGEIQYEKRRITNTSIQARGVLYDGFELARLLNRLIPGEEKTPHHVHIVLTNQLFGTWGDDLRYHYRVSVYSVPSLISTTGIVEAPAKPIEFYLEKQQLAAIGLKDGSLEALKQKYAGQFIDYDDDRMTEIIVGYALQAVLYAATGNPFCSDPDCRFYDAHYQSDLIRAQLQGDKFCENHTALLERLGAKPGARS
jgi:hypothetical protein